MKRFATLVVAFFVAAAPARAHFIWLLPNESDKDKPAARIVFSDEPAPGAAELVKKIGKVAVYSRGLDLKATELKTTEDKDALQVGGLEKGPQVLGAILKYGVFQKGNDAPALIYYYAKSYVGEDLQKAPPKNLLKPWDKLELEIVPLADQKNTVEVLWQGKPLADAELVLYVPGVKEPVEAKTDKNGQYKVPTPARGAHGTY